MVTLHRKGWGFNNKNFFLCVSFLTINMLVCCNAVLADSESFKIFLKSRQFVPETSLSVTDAVSLNQLQAENLKKHGRIDKLHAIVQLTRLPNNAEKEQWKRLGIELLSYIPNNAWYAYISVPIESVTEYADVRSVVMLEQTDKIEPKILNGDFGGWANNLDGTVTLTVTFFKHTPQDLNQAVLNKYGNSIRGPGMINDWIVNIPKTSLHELASEDSVKWIDEIPSPPEDANDGARAAARVNSVQAHINVGEMSFSGSGVKVGMWESSNPSNIINGVHIASHSDFHDRLSVEEDDKVGFPGEHATHVAGTLGGNGSESQNMGGTESQWRGMAPSVFFYSYLYEEEYNPETSEPEEHEAAILKGIDLSNNSWAPRYNLGKYDERSVKYDWVVRGLYGKQIPIIFAAGNEQVKGPFHTIGPGGGTAKNTITVGATNSNNDTLYKYAKVLDDGRVVYEGSSLGPTSDGRIKPDIVAPGCEKGGDDGITSTLPPNLSHPSGHYGLPTEKCGTSYATPVVSGTIALMLEKYRQLKKDETAIPLPSTYKSLLIHTAKDLGNPGPDYQFGYGRIDAKKAIHILDNNQYSEGSITFHEEEHSYKVIIEGNTLSLKATVVWDDYRGDLSIGKRLRNDLDLVVVSPDDTEYLPWILYPHGDEYEQWLMLEDEKEKFNSPEFRNNAIRGKDYINNVEQVVVSNPIAGDWIIKIKGSTVPEAPQTYSLVTSTDTPEFILTANDQHSITVRLSNGDGTFADNTFPIGDNLGDNYGEFAIADYNGDGQLDFIASTNENPSRLYLFIRTGAKTFNQTFLFNLDNDPKATYFLSQNKPLLVPDYGLGLLTADLDNDGDIDFLENINHDFGGNLYWIAKGNAYLNDGSGAFTKVSNTFDFHAISTGWTLGMSNTLMDVDGDNIPDMLASEQTEGSAVSSRVYLLKGKSGGEFELYDKNKDGEFIKEDDFVFITNHHPATFMTLGDFNNDGKVDALVGQDDDGDPGAAFLFKGHGDGKFDQSGVEAFDTRNDLEENRCDAPPGPCSDKPGHGKFQAYDADHDGILDIISAAGLYASIAGKPLNAEFLFFRGHGDGKFDAQKKIDTNILSTTAFTTPPTPVLNIKVIGDLDGNRCVDRIDFDIVLADIRGPEPHEPSYDLNGDGEVDIADARKLVTQFWNPRGEACS